MTVQISHSTDELINPLISHSPKFTKGAKFWMRVETYTSSGETYARFRWGKGRDTFGYAHINGGAADTELVQSRQKEVKAAIERGDDREQIMNLVRSWEGAKRGRKPF